MYSSLKYIPFHSCEHTTSLSGIHLTNVQQLALVHGGLLSLTVVHNISFKKCSHKKYSVRQMRNKKFGVLYYIVS